MMQRVPITKEGYERLRMELQRLQREERPKVIKAIEEARAHGDISENAEFEAAKEKQALIEARINELSRKLSCCEIIAPPKENDGRVVFGSIVVLEDLDTGEINTYRLVGPYEADVNSGTLSVTSPLGQALIGKEEGDNVQVRTPGRMRRLEIVEVKV